ncbi:MAG TPA: septal ring lytic transglycosylase RlpA family protein [Candidatus Eisenbacteria bacterium]|nr:septal ring lytic transglycosylase RlpA family protein [Candidatus Eisenbacteria bacterium]
MRLLVLATRLLLLSSFLAAGCAVSRPVARLDSTPVSAELAILPTPVPDLGGADISTGPEDAPAPAPRPHRALTRGQIGTASFYDASFNGQTTANGDTYDDAKLTAAHRTLGFGTRVRVTNLENHRSVVVTVNDRGPFVGGRVIDLSRRAARALDFVEDGTTRVRVQPL